MLSIKVNTKKKVNKITEQVKKQGRTSFYEQWYYSNFPDRGWGCYYVIYYKEV